MSSAIPNTILDQIGTGVLMSLGASDLMADRVHVPFPEYDTLTFKARILDKQHNKRVMRVQVILDPSDTYSIRVTYPKRGDKFTTVTHYEASDVYFDQLPHLLLALDQVM